MDAEPERANPQGEASAAASRGPRIGGIVLASLGGFLGLLGGCELLAPHEGQLGAVAIVFAFVFIGVGGLVALFGAMLIGISNKPGPAPDVESHEAENVDSRS